MKEKPSARNMWEWEPKVQRRVLQTLNSILFYVSLLGFLVFLYDVGFVHNVRNSPFVVIFYHIYVVLVFLLLTARLIVKHTVEFKRSLLFAEYLLVVVLAIGVGFSFFSGEEAIPDLLKPLFQNNLFSYGVILYVFFVELSKKALSFYHLGFNPAFLFVTSFMVLIFLGAGLLLLPRATVNGISLLDALFTAASAVCVTGLIVVDTATAFTSFGKTIILILIQLGGLGIMTFTSFLATFFQAKSSFQNQLFLKDLVNEENLGGTMRTIGKIVGITFFVEALGAVMIFISLSRGTFPTLQDRVVFSVFHSISAFCNAGFSTLTDGLYDAGIRYNYGFQLVIIFLIIIGGLGFPIIFNLFRKLREITRNRFKQLQTGQTYVHTSRVINVNTKIALITTAVLLVAGTVLYFITEYNHTLRDRSLFGKLMTAFFGAVTPRTAGFNTVDMMELSLPLVLIYLLLMWIGASPGSTGGGIKTTTFALAVLNTVSITKGKDRVEAFGREISGKSVQQAFAVVLLSFLVIGVSTLALSYFNPEIELIRLAFESFSAFSTVGLSLGVTDDLTSGSKVIIIITMFLGRVGIFTLIASIITKVNTYYYRYPTESIIIT